MSRLRKCVQTYSGESFATMWAGELPKVFLCQVFSNVFRMQGMLKTYIARQLRGETASLAPPRLDGVAIVL